MATRTSQTQMTMMMKTGSIPSGLPKHCTIRKTVRFSHNDMILNKRIKMMCLKVDNKGSLKALMCVKNDRDDKKMKNAYFDPLKIFGKKSGFMVKAKSVDDDDNAGEDGDKKPDWLKRLENILKKYEPLTKLLAYFQLIAEIVKFVWWFYKYVLTPAYAIGKKLLEPKPKNDIFVSNKGQERNNKSGKDQSCKGNSQKKEQNEQESNAIWKIQFYKCLFYIYIQVHFHIHFGK